MKAAATEDDRGKIPVKGVDERRPPEAATEARKVLRPDEALKEATQAAVAERWAHIEDRSAFGCVDWYLYPEVRRQEPQPRP